MANEKQKTGLANDLRKEFVFSIRTTARINKTWKIYVLKSGRWSQRKYFGEFIYIEIQSNFNILYIHFIS